MASSRPKKKASTNDRTPRSNLPKANALEQAMGRRKAVRYSGPTKRYTKAGRKAGKY